MAKKTKVIIDKKLSNLIETRKKNSKVYSNLNTAAIKDLNILVEKFLNF